MPMATKAGVRFRYYVSTLFLHGEAKTASAGSVSRIPAADIEEAIVKFLTEHLAAKQGTPTTGAVRLGDRGTLARLRDPPTEWSRQFEALGLNSEFDQFRF